MVMDSLKKYIFELFKNKKFLMIMFLSIVFIGLAVYVYNNYIVPRMQPSYIENKELQEDVVEDKEAELYFFYGEWCPYCKKAMPEWQQFKNEYENKKVNNTTIYFREIDTEKDEKTTDQFDVKGVPTIKLVINNQVIEYDADVKYDTLVEFVHSTL
jgi:thiol-disulfide isomerase/thioredoxin